jgi:hypothetical protein
MYPAYTGNSTYDLMLFAPHWPLSSLHAIGASGVAHAPLM